MFNPAHLNAASTIRMFGGDARAAVPSLVELLKVRKDSPSGLTAATIRCVAATALGKIGPDASTAVPALTEALKDEDPGVQKAAAEALQRIRK